MATWRHKNAAKAEKDLLYTVQYHVSLYHITCIIQYVSS
jgi:hypothetical protein